MTARLAQLACLFLLMGCASARHPRASGVVTVAPPAPDLSGVLRLMGRYNRAHACPIAPDLAITNAHVVDGSTPFRENKLLPHEWATRDGAHGLTVPKQAATFRDLAEIGPYAGEFPRWYPIAANPPQPGDPVWFVGYDMRKKKAAMLERVFAARVVNVVGTYVVMDPSGVPGSSGSCVLNARGEVVAINAEMNPLEDGSVVGGAVGVWAGLLDLGK